MKYLLTFKPLKNFFFGNDRTFTEDYVAISEYFPQNTQLLGAIRLFIAEQHKLMHVHKNGKYSNEPSKLKKLIGTASAKDFPTNSDLGMIQNISQMFIVTKKLDDAYFPTPFDLEIGEASIRYYQLANIQNDYFLKDYDVKNVSSQKLGNKAFWSTYVQKEPLSLSDIEPFDYQKDSKTKQEKGFFISHRQVGIGLENKKTIEGAFYSKTDYQLNDNFLFACLIELDEAIIQDGIIQIGAENSLFELKVIPYEDTKLQDHPVVTSLFQAPHANEKLIAISEAMLEDTHRLDAYFSIIPFYKNFAMIDSERESFTLPSKSKEYAKFKGKTDQKRLIPKGSVIYLKSNMPRQPLGAYAKMGYNQFISAKN
ncbi:MAG: type III-B CRISPR module-associated Cmr3 family protein [Arcobacteraceae bacterium]